MDIRQTDIYQKWFKKLRDRQAKARINIRIRRLSMGNPGDVKPVGQEYQNSVSTTVLVIESTLYRKATNLSFYWRVEINKPKLKILKLR